MKHLQCQGCQIGHICKIAEHMKEASLYAEVHLNGCTIFDKIHIIGTTHVINKDQSVAYVAPAAHAEAPVPKVMKDFREASNAVRKQEQEQNKKFVQKIVDEGITAKIIESEEDAATPIKAICSCGAEVPVEELMTCGQCQGLCCPNCAIDDVKNKGVKVCGICWSK